MRHPITAIAAALLVAGCAASDAPEREIITLPGASVSSVYSPGVRTGNLIFLSGTLGTRPGEGLVEGGVGAETRQSLENQERVLAEAGASRDDIVKCTVFLDNIDDYSAMNEAYGAFFDGQPPARATVAVDALVLNAAVEIECIAALSSG